MLLLKDCPRFFTFFSPVDSSVSSCCTCIGEKEGEAAAAAHVQTGGERRRRQQQRLGRPTCASSLAWTSPTVRQEPPASRLGGMAAGWSWELGGLQDVIPDLDRLRAAGNGPVGLESSRSWVLSTQLLAQTCSPLDRLCLPNRTSNIHHAHSEHR